MTAVQQSPPAGRPAPAAQAQPPTRGGSEALLLPSDRTPSGPARLLPRTVAARVRTLTVLSLVLLVALLGVAWAAIGNAREGVRVIGHDAGPQVVATGDLYFQLSDMDAQLADALLIGDAAGGGREQALARYDQNRRKAGDALLKAAKLADETTENNTARDLLDALARYERLAGQALLLDRQSPHASGPPAQKVVDLYRQATDLMKLDLLPKAYNLTLDNGTLVRHTYEDKRSAVLLGRTGLLVAGVALLAVLLGFQLFLARRFRRLLNVPLALATLGTLALVAAGSLMLTGQANHLRQAKEEGFDSILGLSRTRAISNSANADETRFLLDPGRADAYEQVYLSKSQTVLYLKAGNLTQYNAAVQKDLTFEPGRVRFLGFLGTEADRPVQSARQKAQLTDVMNRVLADYQKVQANDRRMRDLVDRDRRDEAVAARGAAAADFTRYDRSLQALVAIHQKAFDEAVKDGDGGTSGWYAVLPAAGVVIAALVLVGVRPRLAEYRWSK
ncbi:hypothetical protein [Actinomadura citrea]|uniref:Secreted protein n=1 Tax=Actinomadura citrea TaxID=46158 RepID=A0A7Y9G912_9ACTN|nr:hypothetical protein [Actinomadura citrea]NYE12132.1 hypothetical protein [Actinomadura citrea]GGT49822.1 hypothetical protein GCM10010177_01840 [Actinomadura citrea]